MKRIRTILVDDEPAAHERMVKLLSAHPEVEIVGMAGDLESASALCGSCTPDLVFLDIQLPRQSGFALAGCLPATTQVIVVSASERFAFEAFDYQVRDYLLKPVHPQRLAIALSRLVPENPEQGMQVELDDGGNRRFVPMDAVTHIVALDNYSQVFINDGTRSLVRKSLNAWEDSLPNSRFVRVHRSLIIRIDAVRRFSRESRDSGVVFFNGCDEAVALGRRSAKRLAHLLKGRGNHSPQFGAVSPQM